MTDRVRMVNSRGTLESLRHIGITLEEGITELVDNAVTLGDQHSTDLFPERGTRQATLLVADNGVGFPKPFREARWSTPFSTSCDSVGKSHITAAPSPSESTALACPKRPLGCRFVPKSPPRWTVGVAHLVYDLEQLRADRGYLPPEVKEGPNTYHLLNRFTTRLRAPSFA